MRPRHEIREQLFRDGEHDSDELQELILEVCLDIRDLLQLSEDRMVKMETQFKALNPPCGCNPREMHGEAEHEPSCRYA